MLENILKLNFNIPNPKTFFLLSKDISNYKINIDIKSNQIKEDIVEVQISPSLKSNMTQDNIINTEIIYSAIIEISEKNNSKEQIEKIILIDVPTEIYPELRKIFIFIFESSGFKEIKINEKVISKTIKFKKLNKSFFKFKL